MFRQTSFFLRRPTRLPISLMVCSWKSFCGQLLTFLGLLVFRKSIFVCRDFECLYLLTFRGFFCSLAVTTKNQKKACLLRYCFFDLRSRSCGVSTRPSSVCALTVRFDACTFVSLANASLDRYLFDTKAFGCTAYRLITLFSLFGI